MDCTKHIRRLPVADPDVDWVDPSLFGYAVGLARLGSRPMRTAAVIVSLSCASALAQASAVADAGLSPDEVAVLMRRWYAAWDAKDVAAQSAMEHPAFELQQVGIPMLTANQVGQLATVNTSVTLSRTFKDEHVARVEATAVYRGEMRVSLRNVANVMGSYVNEVTATWVKEAGGWKLLHLQTIPGGIEGERERWNEEYRKGTLYSPKPNRLLMDAIAGRKPGRALDVGIGEGRNALALAEKGWDVTGVDISEVGVAKAMQIARERKLKVAGVIQDIDTFDFGHEQWDLIAFIYMGGIDKDKVEQVKAALKHGGIVVIERFNPGAAAKRTIGHGETIVAKDDWSKLYAGWKILKYEEPVDVSDWRMEKTRLVRFVAQKP